MVLGMGFKITHIGLSELLDVMKLRGAFYMIRHIKGLKITRQS